MCGIVGYVGKEQAAPILLDGLSRLEYRGYDSAGVCVGGDGALKVAKTKGRLSNLSEMTHGGGDLPGTFGIGHTRWATHGEPNDVNSHPHLSQDGRIALVHNGIIENYMEIKEMLLEKGVQFASETDSEVVAQLLQYYYRKTSDIFQAVYKVLHRIEGAYALGILCADKPDQIIAARKDAPLLLGHGDGCAFIASDATAIIKHTREVSYMEDGEVALLTADRIQVYNALGDPIEKERHVIDWEISAAEKGGYEHFMFKEIMEEPEALRRTIGPRIRDGRIELEGFSVTADTLRSMSRLYIVACGSSYHVGMVGKYNIEKLLRIPVEVQLASEFRYCDPILDEKTLVIIISQSGETLDTMAALREAKARGARILSIVNVVGSSIARESDDVLYTWAGPEIAVATTKAYSTQLMLLDMITLYFADLLGTVDEKTYRKLVTELQTIPDKLEKVLAQKEKIQYFASQYFNHDSVFFIGRNLDFALGLEGSLKLKEISYIHSEAYASGELKHGTISLIEDGTLVVALSTYGPLLDKAMSNVVEVRARGADVLALTTESGEEALAKNATGVLTVPDTAEMFLPSLGVVPLQLFAYYVALQKGCDIDKPRNLAKSVTVE
ncbi:MAG: glutamine--fructose-6-phosphate transaminase (isomerizing) [Oscillospiraceae bacterium]|nr:glutamine--fructose-6-phosphate transaminase (isomerizing) [Oscillospiraceae bacterium]